MTGQGSADDLCREHLEKLGPEFGPLYSTLYNEDDLQPAASGHHEP